MSDWIESSSEDFDNESPDRHQSPPNKDFENQNNLKITENKFPYDKPADDDDHDPKRYSNHDKGSYRKSGGYRSHNDFGSNKDFAGSNRDGSNRYGNRPRPQNESPEELLAKLESGRKTTTFFLNLYSLHPKTTESEIREFYKGVEILNVWVNLTNITIYD